LLLRKKINKQRGKKERVSHSRKGTFALFERSSVQESVRRGFFWGGCGRVSRKAEGESGTAWKGERQKIPSKFTSGSRPRERGALKSPPLEERRLSVGKKAGFVRSLNDQTNVPLTWRKRKKRSV